MDLAITLEQHSETPLHKQLYDELRRAILTGRLKPGERVPSTRGLSQSLGVSRATVTQSYEQLLSEGYLRAATGSGTFVGCELPDELLKTKPVEKSRHAASLQENGRQGAGRQIELSRYGASIADSTPFEPPESETPINFRTGRPALDEFPLHQWRRLTLKHYRAKDYSMLGYEEGSQGYEPLREAIVGYLRHARAVKCDADQVVIVNGAQQALDLIAKLLIDRGDPVAIENPGYLGVRRVLLAHGAELLPAPVDESGIVVDALTSKSKGGLKLVYVTPSHQFPTGVTLTLPRRLDLLCWAEKTGAMIVEDDYDSEFRFGSRPIPSLQGLANGDSVIYVGTFSKVLFPSLRIGYLVAAPSLARVFARAKWLADRQTPAIEQRVLADFINEGHLERHLRRMRTLYDNRRQTLVRALETNFGDRVAILGGNAGMHLMIRLRSELDDEEIERRARASGVGMVSARLYYLGEGRPSNMGEFVLGYAGLSERRIREGARRLAKILK
ncbi:MAG TPA: PLP-dependent aminotransferase family protein [Blastocatellia bacterium]|jgi:GntR family transcriptional regulator/MocR family aminotransferase|nr:PLP-dependent aminotransferase family protein [Blastocatellia bacterium]